MEKSVKISLIQTDLAWEQTDKNLQNFDRLIEKVPSDSEIVILPEMFSTGFTMNVEKIEKPVGKKAFEWMKNKAKQIDKILVGSILFEQNAKFYNRMFWMPPDGNFQSYDKRHLFQMGGEHHIMTAGNKRTIVEFKGIKFLLQICYDLRFPVWSKNSFDKNSQTYEYDVIIYIANWPESRKYAYENLLKARAIENQSAVIWVNRTGKDGNDIYHSGDTCFVDETGKVRTKTEAGQEQILTFYLNKEQILNTRNSFKVGLDWDNFKIFVKV